MADHAYQVGANVAHEVLGGEAILINFTTGSYYSLDGTGGAVWEHLSQGPVSASTLATALAAESSFEPAHIVAMLARFLEELEKEGLVARSEHGPGGPAEAARFVPAAGAPAFSPPVLKKYTDLEALLLLDPIHDVLAGGWPNRGPGA